MQVTRPTTMTTSRTRVEAAESLASPAYPASPDAAMVTQRVRSWARLRAAGRQKRLAVAAAPLPRSAPSLQTLAAPRRRRWVAAPVPACVERDALASRALAQARLRQLTARSHRRPRHGTRRALNADGFVCQQASNMQNAEKENAVELSK
jgi:hypothetical protein